MICPSCKCEYRSGVTQCSDCGVPLVDTLDQPEAAPALDGRIESVWAGNDPSECAAVKEALEKADIPFIDQATSGYFIFPSLRSKMEILVSRADSEKAKKLLKGMGGRVDHDELTPEEIESLALPDSGDPDTEQSASSPSVYPADWPLHEDDGEAASEVWNGESEDLADTLIACLREIGISSRKLSQEGRMSLVVRPEDESMAKEIVREVVEASPPE